MKNYAFSLFVWIWSLLIMGCSLPIERMKINNEVYMDVYKAEVKDDGFQIKVKFIIDNYKYPHVIQELNINNNQLELVEAFKRNPFSFDVHFRKSKEPFTEKRVMKVYLGEVSNVDWDYYGFCQLPQNKDGTVITKIPSNWNERYQNQYKTKGYVKRQSEEWGIWTIEYNSRDKSLKIVAYDKTIKVP